MWKILLNYKSYFLSGNATLNVSGTKNCLKQNGKLSVVAQKSNLKNGGLPFFRRFHTPDHNDPDKLEGKRTDWIVRIDKLIPSGI